MNKNFQLLIPRIFFGGLMIINHGIVYLLQLWPFNDIPIDESKTMFGLGSMFTVILFFIGEFLAPFFVFIGFNTKLSSFICMTTMFIAIIIEHIDNPISGGEKPLLFFAGFLIIFLMGPGKYSVNKK